MSKTCNRKFKEGEEVYVVDWWGTSKGTQAFEAAAEIIEVEEESFLAVLYGDTYQRYSFKDYGRLIFDDKDEAEKAAEKLPKPGSTVWLIDEDYNISKSKVKGIEGGYFDEIFNLTIELEDNKSITTDRIGTEVFLSEESVKEKKKTLSTS